MRTFRTLSTCAAGLALVVTTAACSTTGGETNAPAGEAQEVGDITIGFAQRTSDAPYYVAMQREAERLAEEEGFDLRFQSAGGDPVAQLDQVQTLLSQGVDALIVNAVSAETERTQLQQAAEQVPLLFIDTSIEGVGFTAVQSDNVTIGREAGLLTAERLGSGTTIQLAILNGGPADEAVGPARREGFLAGLEEGGIEYEIAGEATANYTQEEAVARTEDLLASNADIDLIFGYNDAMALGALTTLRNQNNSDVLVAGIDGQKEALAEISEGCESQYVATGLNSPALAARQAVEAAIAVATGEAEPDSFDEISYTEAVGIGCENVEEYYDPESDF